MKPINYFQCLAIVFLFTVSAKDCKKSEISNCFRDRKTVKTIDSAAGWVSKQGRNNYIIILSGGQRQRYSPCNLGPQWKFDNKKVVISGDEKEVYAHERWAGLPFVVNEIREQ